jgi:uncharacterized protein YcbK (DUF882 family)
MHRFMVSLLACLGALTLPHRNGRAEPPAVKTPARTESVAAKDDSEPPSKPGQAVQAEGKDALKKASDPDANGKSEAGPKKTDMAPGVARKSPAGEPNATKGAAAGSNKSAEADARAQKPASSTTAKGSVQPKSAPAWTRGQPGVVKLVRGSETLEVRVLDKKQHLVAATVPQFARFLRAKSGADHPIDARLVTLVATVSDHFGGREMTVISGFRPYSPGQHSRHSNHNEGRAIDFSIKGVANEKVRDFCRTFRNVGVGYYPNSLFVHLDVREGNAYWVDYAAPGQAPRYRAPDGREEDEDDEGDAIASVDGGSSKRASAGNTPRADVTRGRNVARGGDRDVTGQRGVFVDR